MSMGMLIRVVMVMCVIVRMSMIVRMCMWHHVVGGMASHGGVSGRVCCH
jgi:hypothetical protein